MAVRRVLVMEVFSMMSVECTKQIYVCTEYILLNIAMHNEHGMCRDLISPGAE